MDDPFSVTVPMMYFPSAATHGMPIMPPVFHGCCSSAYAPLVYMAADEEDKRSLPDHLRCGYTSKRCANPRTIKKSGGLHRFCAYHRERANKNQWRVDNRRRIQKRENNGKSPTKSTTSSTSDCDCDSPRSTTSSSHEPLNDSNVSEFALLFGDQESENGKIKVETITSVLWVEGLGVAAAAGSLGFLSDQDAAILHAMLFSEEESTIPSAMEAQVPGPQPVEACNFYDVVGMQPSQAPCSCLPCLESTVVPHYRYTYLTKMVVMQRAQQLADTCILACNRIAI